MGMKAFKAFWRVDYPEAYKKLAGFEKRALCSKLRPAYRRDKRFWLYLGLAVVWFTVCVWASEEMDTKTAEMVCVVLGACGVFVPCQRYQQLLVPEIEKWLEKTGGAVDPQLVIRHLRRQSRTNFGIAIFLYLLFSAAAFLLARTWIAKTMRELDGEIMATHAGFVQAQRDFSRGIRRVYVLGPDLEQKFTGHSNGPFEVWNYYDLEGSPLRNEFVSWYNRMMRAQYEDSLEKAKNAPDSQVPSPSSAPAGTGD